MSQSHGGLGRLWKWSYLRAAQRFEPASNNQVCWHHIWKAAWGDESSRDGFFFLHPPPSLLIPLLIPCNLLRSARRRHSASGLRCSALCSVVLANQKGPIDNQTLFLRWLPSWTEDSRGADVREAEMEIGNCDCDVCHSHWDRLHHLFTLKHSCRAICLNLFLFSDWFFFCFLWLDISNILIWSFRRWLLFEPRKKSLLPVAVYFLKKWDMKVSFFFFLDGNVSDQTCSALWNRFRWEKKNASMHLAEMFISWFLIEPWKAKSCFWLTPISTVRGRAVKIWVSREREHILYCV